MCRWGTIGMPDPQHPCGAYCCRVSEQPECRDISYGDILELACSQPDDLPITNP